MPRALRKAPGTNPLVSYRRPPVQPGGWGMGPAGPSLGPKDASGGWPPAGRGRGPTTLQRDTEFTPRARRVLLCTSPPTAL